MRSYRTMLLISYIEHQTNVSVLKHLQITKRFSTRINLLNFRYFRQISRRTTRLGKFIIEGKKNGRRRNRRSPTRWIDQKIEGIGHGIQEAAQRRMENHYTCN